LGHLRFDLDLAGGNGTMFSLLSPSRTQVDAVYAAARAQGAVCEGAPCPTMARISMPPICPPPMAINAPPSAVQSRPEGARVQNGARFHLHFRASYVQTHSFVIFGMFFLNLRHFIP
jgi:hypothetical protein